MNETHGIDAAARPATPLARADVEAAARRIAGYVRRTPVLEIRGADLGVGDATLILKLELLQHTGSFKPRGAFNRVLGSAVPESGIIAASGGNHAQAVAYVAHLLGHRAEIYVPQTAPEIKVARLRALGAHIVQVGDYYDAARLASEERAAETGALVVHAFDQPEIVAGAATLGRELGDQAGDLDAVVVAVGGGGLIGGTAAWFRGDVPITAVEPRACPTLYTARQVGRPVPVDVSGHASDSLAAAQVGDIPFACASRWVQDAVLVEDDDIRRAQALLWDRLRIIAEPGGATALAGILCGAVPVAAGSRVAVLVSGGNTDPAAVANPATVASTDA